MLLYIYACYIYIYVISHIYVIYMYVSNCIYRVIFKLISADELPIPLQLLSQCDLLKSPIFM